MCKPPYRRLSSQSGFIITVEALFLFTIVVLAVVVALAGLRNALIDSGLVLRPTLVFDSSAPDRILVGKVVDFDDSETPRFLRRDPNTGLTVLLGARVDRFTSHEPVFYSVAGCVGAAYVIAPSAFGPAPGSLADVERLEGRVGSFNRMRGAVYAIGFSPLTVGPVSPYGTGLLFRDDPATAPALTSVASAFVSSWDHTDAAPGDPDPLNPCRSLVDVVPGLVPALPVTDPAISANLLAPFIPPFVVP